MKELYFFDPTKNFTVLERRLPHWSQVGVICFVTFRLADSLPKSVVMRILAERRHWLRCQGINPDNAEWRIQLRSLPDQLQREFFRRFFSRWNDALDDCHGRCHLRDPEMATIVADTFQHFDGQRYELTDFVVMPNHAHLLVAFPNDQEMLRQCESWKRFSARRMNALLEQTGRLWMQDRFDHLVRSLEQFEHFRNYIANNPTKANLQPGEWIHYQKDLGAK